MARERPWPETSLMASLSAAERQELLSAGTPVRFGRGEILLRQGEPGGMLFVVVAGFAKVTAAAAGSDVMLALRGRGDLLGEFTVIDDKPRTATVVAIGALAAVRIGRGRFMAFCDQNPAANRKIMQSLTDKVRRASDRRAAAGAADARVRIAAVLCDLAVEHGAARPDGSLLLPPLAQAELGAFAAVAGSTVERVMHDLRAKGIVASGYRKTVVLDLAALRAMAELVP